MDIKTLALLLRRNGLHLFKTRDLAILCPKADSRLLSVQLHQWTKKGWVARIKRGVYELTFPEASATPDFYVSNVLYEPSYVSLETALSHYQLIPEVAAQVTAVSTKPTRRFLNAHGLFTYSTVRPQAFAGYRTMSMQGYVVRIAEPEKALVDRVYAALRRGEDLGERWDRARLRRLDQRKLEAYAGLFAGYGDRIKEAVHALPR